MPRTPWIVVALALITISTSRSPAQDAPKLMAGVASADITPEPGLRMWGYSNRPTPATGTLDPLMAKALVLRVGDHSAAIVALDLGRVPPEALLNELKKRTQVKAGIGNLFVTASHTHAAPSLEPLGGQPNEYSQRVVEAIERIVIEAAGKMTEVRLGVGQTTADYGHNRRRILPDGRVAMQWRNVEREPTSPVDAQATVLRLDRMDGSPLAVVLHYACHPVVLGPDNLEYSSDWVGAARAVVESQLKTTMLFLQGGCGDINPYVDKTPLDQNGVGAMRKMGEAIGKLVVEAAGTISPMADTAASVAFDERVVPIGVRWDVHDEQVRSTLRGAYGPRFDNYLAGVLQSGVIRARLTTLVVNRLVALVGMPGEFFTAFQVDVKQRSPVPFGLLVGYTGEYYGYFPTIRDAALGGYGGITATFVEAGAGERLADEAIVTLYQLEGKLAKRPAPQDFQLIEWDEIKGKLPANTP